MAGDGYLRQRHTSSCLYVSAFALAAAGRYAAFALLIVAGVLFLFRRVYSEVGSVLPLNGGSYTLLLNSTNKKLAAAAACLTLLSYIATAVISSGEAMHYAHQLFSGLNVFRATVALLGFFAILNLVGITESATVALGIFAFHMVTLTVLSVASGIAVLESPETLTLNWVTPTPEGLLHALFFGFAAAMLGISGFESSANFILLRIPLLQVLLFITRGIAERILRLTQHIDLGVRRQIGKIKDQTVVYFTRGDDLPTLNRAALYVLKNEQTKRMKVVHVFEREEEIPTELAEHLHTVDHLYPQLRIDFLGVRGKFGPETIERLSKRLRVPKNYMFIGTPGDRFPHQISDLGGVRLIL